MSGLKWFVHVVEDKLFDVPKVNTYFLIGKINTSYLMRNVEMKINMSVT